MTVDIKRVQARLLEMAKILTEILENNDIPYMISFGTLLGAVRHNGFIPWDDDFDICLFEEDYKKAIDTLKTKIPADLILEDIETEPNHYHSWNRVKCKNTITHSKIYPFENIYKNKGLQIDLFKLKKLRKNEVKTNRIKENISYLKKIRNINLINNEEYSKKIKKLKYQLYYEKNKNRKHKKHQEYVYDTILSPKTIKSNEIFPLKKYKFENIQLFGPNQFHPILVKTYGDYMSIPEEGKRKIHYEYVSFKNEK